MPHAIATPTPCHAIIAGQVRLIFGFSLSAAAMALTAAFGLV
jgi:hypothetical protein